MGENKPLVTIVIPTYNRATHLPATIDSCISQEYSNLEIIVVDDGSTDDTPKYLDSLAGKLGKQRLRVVYQENQGANAARNKALDLMHGSYVQFLDSDDRLAPEKIRIQVEALQKSGNALAVCDYRNVMLDEKPPKIDTVSNDVNLFKHLAMLYPATISVPLYRTDLIGKYLRFNSLLKWKDEMDFIFKFGLLIRDWDYTPGAYFDYCHHHDQRITMESIDTDWYWEMFLGQQAYWYKQRAMIHQKNYWMLRTCWLKLARLAKAAGRGDHARAICHQITLIPGVSRDIPAIAKVYIGSYKKKHEQAIPV